MKSGDAHRVLRYALGIGAIGYALVSLAQSKRFADLTKTEEDVVHQWAMRDLGSGVEILTAENPAPALVSRALYDFSDGLRLLNTRPLLAPVAFFIGLLAIVAILTRPAAPDEA